MDCHGCYLLVCVSNIQQPLSAAQEEMFNSEETATDRMDTIMKYTQVLPNPLIVGLFETRTTRPFDTGSVS